MTNDSGPIFRIIVHYVATATTSQIDGSAPPRPLSRHAVNRLAGGPGARTEGSWLSGNGRRKAAEAEPRRPEGTDSLGFSL